MQKLDDLNTKYLNSEISVLELRKQIESFRKEHTDSKIYAKVYMPNFGASASAGTFDGYAKTLENKLGDLSTVSRSVASGVTTQSVMAERQANALEKVAETATVQKEHLEYLKTPTYRD